MRGSTRQLAAATALVALALATGGAAAASGAATGIEGKVTVMGSKTSAGAVVYLDAIPGRTFEPPAEPVAMDQVDLRFVPRVLPVLVGTTVDFLNNDTVMHNVFTPDKIADRFDLGTFGKGETRTYTFDKPGVAALLCNVHPEMEGYVVVVPTPYFALAAEDGSYRLEDVPPGEHVLNVWHPRLRKPASRAVSVGESGVVTADLQVR